MILTLNIIQERIPRATCCSELLLVHKKPLKSEIAISQITQKDTNVLNRRITHGECKQSLNKAGTDNINELEELVAIIHCIYAP